ncbi:MAG: putative porin [Pseudomonadales bacterium]
MKLGYGVLLTGLLVSLAGVAQAATSDADEVARLRAQVEALSARLTELERRSERTSVAVEDLQSEPAPTAAAADPALDWARKVQLKGDLRYRHEWIDEQGDPDRTRHRIRARFGAKGALSDDLQVQLQFATGSDDPRSTNQTLGDNFTTKGVGVDLAYVDWAALDGVHVLAGKMKNPVSRPDGSRFIDNDITPEGIAATWQQGNLFLLGSGFWAVERGSDDDTMAMVVQGGYRGRLDNGMSLTAAVSYTDWMNARGYAPFYDGNPFGNSTDAGGNLLYDFNILEGYGELGLSVRDMPLRLFAQYGVNLDANDDDTAFALGATLGKASGPGTWEVGYAYQDVEKDALFAQIVDSDFAGGQTDARGHIISGTYALTSKVGLSLTFFANELDVSVPSQRDYDRLQLDLNFKY